MLCPKCRKTELTYYNGSLGYESLTCGYCNLDIKSEEAITACNNYEGEMRMEIKELKDKLHRRNMQIKDNGKRLADYQNKLTQRANLIEQILNMTNIHGVYKDDTDCINSIREAIIRNTTR